MDESKAISVDDIPAKMARTLAGRQELSSFITNSIHRLRSTLTVTRIYTELIQSGMYGTLEDEMMDKLGSIESNIDELSVYMDIIQDVNLLTQVPDPYREDTDLLEIVMDIVKGMSSRQSSRIRMEPASSPARIIGEVDRGILRKTLRNLLAYSLCNTDPGSEVRVLVDADEDRPFIKVVTEAEPPSEEEIHSLLDSLGGSGSALSAQEWRSLTYPIAMTFWEMEGHTLSVEGCDDSNWSYRIDVQPPFC